MLAIQIRKEGFIYDRKRVYNFSAGPSMLPVAVLEKQQTNVEL